MILELLIAATLLHGKVEDHEKTLGVIGICGSNKYIYQVQEGSPAEQAGLKAGDKIKKVYDKDIDGEPYTQVKLKIYRSSLKLTFYVIVQRLPYQLVGSQSFREYFSGSNQAKY